MAKRVWFDKKWQISVLFSSMILNIGLKTFYARLNRPFFQWLPQFQSFYVVFNSFHRWLLFFLLNIPLLWHTKNEPTYLFSQPTSSFQEFSRGFSFFQESNCIPGVSRSSGYPAINDSYEWFTSCESIHHGSA